MAEKIHGTLEIKEADSRVTTITLDGDGGVINAKKAVEAGKLRVVNPEGATVVMVDRTVGNPLKPSIQAGRIRLSDDTGKLRVELDGRSSTIMVGGEGSGGDLSLKGKNDQVIIRLDGEGGSVWLGGHGRDGDLVLFAWDETEVNNHEKSTIHLDGDSSTVTLRVKGQQRVQVEGQEGNIWLGGNGVDGDLVLFAWDESEVNNHEKSTIHLNGNASTVTLRVKGQQRVQVDGQQGNIWLGGNGADGDLMLFNRDETDVTNHEKATIHLDGDAGDIVLRNADFAEDFDVAVDVQAEPGAVMVLDGAGQLRPCQRAYDKRVAGVLSGAGAYKPGIVLDRKAGITDRQPVALVGKVYCRVDARYGAIVVGDLLTTSPTPGHAMKATDPLQAFGAVIGKALRPLGRGHGLIPILIALQ